MRIEIKKEGLDICADPFVRGKGPETKEEWDRFYFMANRYDKDDTLAKDLAPIYHKKKRCRLCKGRLELSRYYDCEKCKKPCFRPSDSEYTYVDYDLDS